MAVLDLREGVEPLRSLTHKLVETAARPDRTKSFGVYFMPSDSEFSTLARFVEREVFLQRFGNDASTMDREYGPFEDGSDFVLCVDHTSYEPIGVLRLIRPGPWGLKTLLDVAAEPRWGADVDLFLSYHQPVGGIESVHDIATFAVRGRWTDSTASIASSQALYAALYRWCLSREIEVLVGAIDEVVASLIRALHIPLNPLCGLPAITYLGSDATRPYVISVAETSRLMRDDAILRNLLTASGVDREFSFPPIDLDAVGVDLHAELRPRTVDETPEVASSVDAG